MMAEYLINWSENLGWENNHTVQKKYNNINKTVKEKYIEIMRKNDNISKEDLKSQMDKDLKNDKGKYKKGYQEYYNNAEESILIDHELYLKKKEKEKQEEERKRENIR